MIQLADTHTKIGSSMFLMWRDCPILTFKVSPCRRPERMVTLLESLTLPETRTVGHPTCQSDLLTAKQERGERHSLCSSNTPLPVFPAVSSLFPLLVNTATFLLTTSLTGLIYVNLSGIISLPNSLLIPPG